MIIIIIYYYLLLLHSSFVAHHRSHIHRDSMRYPLLWPKEDFCH